MRNLIDKDISKWNKRFDNKYFISSNEWYTSNFVSSQTLSIKQKDKDRMGSVQLKDISDPQIKYDFSFSVTENRKYEFFRIHSSLLKRGIINKVSLNGVKNDISMIPVSISKKENLHEIYDRKYIRHSYKLEGSLTSIIAYVTILEDTIEYFQKIWGYDESGNEHSIIKYPIGTIVSEISNKSSDYMVIDYHFNIYNGEYHIDYIVSEIESDPKSSIIKYGRQMIIIEDKLSYSRNNRIDNLLN